jgi:ketosteroid isomerase-like protein
MKGIYWIIGLLVSVSVMSWTSRAQTQGSPLAAASSASSADMVEIARLREQWLHHWNAGNLQAILQSYAPEAVLLPANGQRVSGRDAIAKYWQQALASGMGTLSLEPLSSGQAGALAYESGRLKYTAAGAPPNQPHQVSPSASAGPPGHPVEGNYLVVLRREPDGRWLILQHAFTEAVMKGLLEDKRQLVKPYPSAPVTR